MKQRMENLSRQEHVDTSLIRNLFMSEFMNSRISIHELFTTMAFLAVICVALFHQQYTFAAEKTDPCKAFKELTKYVEILGLQAVATGDEDAMSDLIDDFRHYATMILGQSPPENGKC